MARVLLQMPVQAVASTQGTSLVAADTAAKVVMAWIQSGVRRIAQSIFPRLWGAAVAAGDPAEAAGL
jgi:hypothetical protein